MTVIDTWFVYYFVDPDGDCDIFWKEGVPESGVVDFEIWGWGIC